jgi:uncharacterized coiled-coil protein SlyX
MPYNPTMEEKKKKIVFEPTINLGHILTFLGFLLTGFGAYSTVDKRITVLEERKQLQVIIDNKQDQERLDVLNSYKDSVSEIKHSLDKLSDKVDVVNDKVSSRTQSYNPLSH